MPILDNKNTNKETESFKVVADYFESQVEYSYIPNGIVSQMLVPEIGMAAMGLMNAIMNEQSKVPAELKMLIAYMSSYARGCTYCQTATYTAARDGYSNSEKFAKIWEYHSSDLFSDAERAALDLALAAAASPSDVTDELRAKLKSHYSQAECAEIIAMIAMFAYFNAWNDTNGTRVDESVASVIDEELLGKGQINEDKYKNLQSV